MPFETNVFINCPFDAAYRPLLQPLLFTVIHLGLQPRIALEVIDGGQSRIDKIVGLIRDSKFSIHDLSRMESSQAGELYRLNLAFELGIDFGCRQFGDAGQQQKKSLVLDSQAHRYRTALSDLSGCDIESHGDKPQQIVKMARQWLCNACKVPARGPTEIFDEFTQFLADNRDTLIDEGFSPQDVEDLHISELIGRMQDWLAAPPGP